MRTNNITLEINSRRQYSLLFFEGNDHIVIHDISISDIYNQTDEEEDEGCGGLYEWKYSLQDEIDTLLDMKLGETVNIYGNRDDKNSLGAIKRTR
jgi:hypothetical protein